MYNYNSNFMPYSNSYPFSYNQQNSIVKVNGIEGAKQFQMQPNDMCALFDANEDLFYIKTTDGAGFATLRTFRYTEEPAVSSNGNEYVTRKEFNELLEMVKNGNVSISNATE